jgi:c-di-GMP-binding flagellar brake protein YcgR
MSFIGITSDVWTPDFDQSDKRAHPRLRCAGTAELHFFPAGTQCQGSLVDLSLGGCCVESEEPIHAPAGSRMEIYLRVMGTTVQVQGVLCHVRHDIWAGVQFNAVSSRKATQIQELIDELFEEV